jgi:hypothetical protein
MMIALTGCTQWTEEQRKRQSLPDYSFEAWDGGVLNRKDLKEGTPLTVFYYDPDCEHCKGTLESIVASLDKFGENALMIISAGDRDRFIIAMMKGQLLHRQGVMIGVCAPQDFLDTFGTTQTPTTLFYGGDWDLKRAYKGAMSLRMVDEGLAAAKGE